MGYAVALGVLGAFAGLIFMGAIGAGGKWYVDSNPNWLGGHWWWVAVTIGAGAVVAFLRRLSRLPDQTPGLIDDLQSGHVEPGLIPGIVAVSAASLIGGASLGPEKALGTIGGGAGSWIAGRQPLDADASQVTALSGFSGAYGGLFSSPVIVVMFLMEVARPGGQRFTKALAGTIVASAVSFGIYFAIAGSVFLDAYQVPQYSFHDWQLAAAIPLGLFATVVVTLLGAAVLVVTRLFERLKVPSMAKPLIGGAVFGVVGVLLPLTLFTGSSQLKTVLHDAGTFGGRFPRRSHHRQDADLRGEWGEWVRRRPDLPGVVHRRDRGRLRQLAHPGRPAGPGVHVPASSCTRVARRGSLHDGAPRGILDPSGRAPDGPDLGRRRHRVPRRGGREVSEGESRSEVETHSATFASARFPCGRVNLTSELLHSGPRG
jgi:hypothetical protein